MTSLSVTSEWNKDQNIDTTLKREYLNLIFFSRRHRKRQIPDQEDGSKVEQSDTNKPRIDKSAIVVLHDGEDNGGMLAENAAAAVNVSDECILPENNEGSTAVAQPRTEEQHPDVTDNNDAMNLYADIPSMDTQVGHTSASGASNTSVNDGGVPSNIHGYEYAYVDKPPLNAASKSETQEKNHASSSDSEYAYAEVNMKSDTTTVGSPRIPTDSDQHMSSDHDGSPRQESTGYSYAYAEVRKSKRNESDTAPKILGSELASSETPCLTTSSDGGHQMKYPESSDETEHTYAEVNMKKDTTANVGNPRIPNDSDEHMLRDHDGSSRHESTGYSYAYAEVEKSKRNESETAPKILGSELASCEKPYSTTSSEDAEVNMKNDTTVGNPRIPTDSNQHVAIDGSPELQDTGYSYAYAEVKKKRNHHESDMSQNIQEPECKGEPMEKDLEYAYAEVKRKNEAGTPRIPNNTYGDSNQHALSGESDYTYAEVNKKTGHHEPDIAEEGWEENVSYHDSSVGLGGADKGVVNEDEGWVDNSIYNMEK